MRQKCKYIMKKTFQEVRFSIFIFTKSELTNIKGPCLRKLVTWLELKNLINSRTVSMEKQLKFKKSITPIFVSLE